MSKDWNNNGGETIEDGDWCTGDYCEWWESNQRGRFVVEGIEHPESEGGWGKQIKARMEKDGWFPNCWYIGERGDANLLDLETEEYLKFTSAELDAAIAEYESLQDSEEEFEDEVLELVYAD